MRTRKEITKEYANIDERGELSFIMEVLLDIRDLLLQSSQSTETEQ